jgi:uncharacterized protein
MLLAASWQIKIDSRMIHKEYIKSIIVALAVVICAMLVAHAWKTTHQGRRLISVTGLASKDFKSDLIIWRGAISRKAMNSSDAYTMLNNDMLQTKEYLVKNGVNEKSITFNSIDISKDYERKYDNGNLSSEKFNGYILSQQFVVESNEIDKVEMVSRNISELIKNGIELTSFSPAYYFTKLAEIKLQLLGNATKDGKQRAENIASNANSSIKKLKSADMGIFQITGLNSGEDYSWGGAFNTSSKYKTATVTVKLEFDIE